jgi:hypothetical protein
MAACPHCYAKITEPPSMLRGDLAYCVECGKYIPRKQLLDNNYVPPPINPAPWGRVERCVLLVNGDEQIARVRFNPLWSRLAFLLAAVVWCGVVASVVAAMVERREWNGIAWMSPLVALGLILVWLAIRRPEPLAEIGRRGEEAWVAWGVAPFVRRESFKAHSVQGIRIGMRPALDNSDAEPFAVVEVVLTLSRTQLGCRLSGNELHWMVHAARQMFECGDGERRERNAAPCAEL